MNEQHSRQLGAVSLGADFHICPPNRTKVLIYSALFLGLVLVFLAIFQLAGPRMVTLVQSSDMTYLAEIRDYLANNNFAFETGEDGRTISVSAGDRPNIRMSLAQAGIAGACEGPGYAPFGNFHLGAAERDCTERQVRAVEDELARTIRAGTQFDSVRVAISVPQPTLFQEDWKQPYITVRIVPVHSPSQQAIYGIQQIVANAIYGLDPASVVVLDEKNRHLSGARKKTEIRISEKDYRENSSIPGEPGVDSNIQDTGIGASGAGSPGTTIEDVIGNYEYSRSSTRMDSGETLLRFPESTAVISDKHYTEESVSVAVSTAGK